MRILGQQFSAGVIERIRGAVVSEPGLTRSALSRRVCDWLDWGGELAAQWSAPAFRGDLADLGPVELVAVEEDAQSARWRTLLERYHPLGSGPLCGARQRYLIRSPIGWLGGLAFSAAAWHLAPRDEWIGWSAQARCANLSRVVSNSRFLLLPTVEVPNLGSHVLGLAPKRLQMDWLRPIAAGELCR